jgi:HAD superfamily hydrolase (TIGR01509 family)
LIATDPPEVKNDFHPVLKPALEIPARELTPRPASRPGLQKGTVVIDASPHRCHSWSFDPERAFGAIVSGDSNACAKAAADIFLEAARQLGAHPDRCIVLENSLAGVQAARATRMRVIAIPERDAERLVGVADAFVGDLTGARSLLAV